MCHPPDENEHKEHKECEHGHRAVAPHLTECPKPFPRTVQQTARTVKAIADIVKHVVLIANIGADRYGQFFELTDLACKAVDKRIVLSLHEPIVLSAATAMMSRAAAVARVHGPALGREVNPPKSHTSFTGNLGQISKFKLTKSQPRTGHKFKLPVQNTGGNRETATQAHGSSTHSVTGTSHARLHARAQRTATELHMTTHGVRCMDADTMAAGGRVPQLRTPNSELNRHRGPMRVLKSMGPVFKPATRKPAGSARHLQRLTSCNPSGSRSTIHHTPCHTRSRQETLSKRARCTMDGWSVGARYCAFSCSRQLLHCHATIYSFTTIVIIKCDLEAVADDLPHLTRRE